MSTILDVRSLRRHGLLAAFAVLAVGAGTARADNPGAATGTLTCHAPPGLSFVLGSAYSMDCVFVRAGGQPEPYRGEVRRVGIDLGFRQATTMVWAVFMSGNGRPGSITGRYVGLSAGATPVVGVGANALIGGSERTVSLQPLSVELRTGLNVNVAVADLTLRTP